MMTGCEITGCPWQWM